MEWIVENFVLSHSTSMLFSDSSRAPSLYVFISSSLTIFFFLLLTLSFPTSLHLSISLFQTNYLYPCLALPFPLTFFFSFCYFLIHINQFIQFHNKGKHWIELFDWTFLVLNNSGAIHTVRKYRPHANRRINSCDRLTRILVYLALVLKIWPVSVEKEHSQTASCNQLYWSIKIFLIDCANWRGVIVDCNTGSDEKTASREADHAVIWNELVCFEDTTSFLPVGSARPVKV